MTGPLPSLFIPHGGGPCFFMDWDPPDTWNAMAAWLKGLSASLPSKPKAIIVVSAHWEEDAFTVTGSAQPDLIFDYSGFPEHTYTLTYPVPGAPDLAQKVIGLLEAQGIAARSDPTRGYDHGVFIPFKLIYPDADIPVIQLSLKTGLDPAEHIAAGQALASLREEGVLIVGSGMSYHNLRAFFRSGADVEKTSDSFDTWLSDAVMTAPVKKLQIWEQAPFARHAHPRAEHLLPLMVAAGAAEGEAGQKIFSDRVMGATVSAFRFG